MAEVKKRRRRKPMTEEQRKAAAERLAKAREERMKKNPPKYTNIHPDVVALPEDHALSMQNVKLWIKTQKELASIERKKAAKNEKGAYAKLARHEGYARSMQSYLQDGIWRDLFYGEFQENRMGWVAKHPGYDKDGNVKPRSPGIFYMDIGCEWTVEMAMQEKNNNE